MGAAFEGRDGWIKALQIMRSQLITLTALDLTVQFERLLSEISRKFNPTQMTDHLLAQKV